MSAPTHFHTARCPGCRSLTVVSAATGRCLDCPVPVAAVVPTTPAVASRVDLPAALRTLGVTAGDDDTTTAWRLALVVAARGTWEWTDTYTHAAAHGLALALLRGDGTAVARCAHFLVRPGEAMAALFPTVAVAVPVAPAVAVAVPTAPVAVPVAARPSTRPTALPRDPRGLRDLSQFGIEQPWRVAS